MVCIDEVLGQWQKVVSGLHSLNGVKIPRCLNQTVVCITNSMGFVMPQIKHLQLLLTYSDGSVEGRIVGSKTRVASYSSY